MLTVTGRQYGAAGTAILDTVTDPSPTTADPNATADYVVNDAKYRAHKIDLTAALEKSAAAWVNGEKHVDLARTAIEKQLRILEADIGLSETAKTTAWQAVQDAILDQLFGYTGEKATARAALPGQLGTTYSLSRNQDFVGAVQEVLDALQSNDALKAALSVKGIFYVETGTKLANKNGKDASGDVNMFDKRNSRLQYLIGSTDFTRFGAWRRQTSPNAKTAYVDRTESAQGDGPSSLAYSQLAKTSYRDADDPRFPAGARMTYEGSTIAVQRGVFWQGEVSVEVLWNAATVGGTVNMSISEIENVANGERMYIDLNTANNDVTDDPSTTADESLAQAIEEVASIDFANLDVDAKLGLSLGAGDTVTVRSLKRGTIAQTSTTLHTGATNAGVKGQFVGQDLRGPLAVLGTWNMSDVEGARAIGVEKTVTVVNDTDPNNITTTNYATVIGINTADGAYAGSTAQTIHGGFGAEVP